MIHLPAAPGEPMEPVPPGTGLVASYTARLEVAGKLGTAEGDHVLVLAALLAAGGTASGIASLSRELRAAAAEVLADAPRTADGLDELDARRQQKAAGA